MARSIRLMNHYMARSIRNESLHGTINPVNESLHGKINPVNESLHGTINPVNESLHGTINPVNESLHGTINPVNESLHGKINPVNESLHGTINPVNESLHGTINPVNESLQGTINPVNESLHGKSKNIPKIHRDFAWNFLKIFCHIICPKSFCPRFSVDFRILRKLSVNSPKISRKIISHEFCQKYFPGFYHSPNFSENLETSLVHMRFQFCSAAEFIGQNCPILSDGQPVRMRERRTG